VSVSDELLGPAHEQSRFELTRALLFNGHVIVDRAWASWAQHTVCWQPAWRLRQAHGTRDPVATANVLAGLRDLLAAESVISWRTSALSTERGARDDRRAFEGLSASDAVEALLPSSSNWCMLSSEFSQRFTDR
jgi:hypothetical protein